ncbi:MAG: hypothetical protein GTO45_39665 [Candidatus Aminicenantes bacterium]|nr:hypothetical protein [Candidatus Aminicenantes bacterium]NIM84746.1 hypothetical protein [Candidatus Aminicenantes bacterium]NIN24239.1 hypothetical protein [Candidatus Aminicenantes bacterium]NIN47999.1 hypothetical protein [Candidatus Aminicenantes bacterium]NIN90902.1 hypothetical protein [Candidatus Aminicenantes bacterium]
MKVFFFISLILITFTINVFGSEIKPLSQIGEEDSNALELIKGQWVIDDTRFIHHYTGRFAVRIDGLKYYLYKRLHSNSRYPHVYTIIKSKKTGRSYFARGRYENGRFIGTTSRIVFKGKNRFIVYSQKNPKKVYFKAARVRKQ